MSARNSVHHKRKPSLLFSSAPHHTAKHLHKCAQPFTFLVEVELQKYLNTCLRKVVTRTPEHFLNIFEMFCRVFSSSPLSIFHSAPIIRELTNRRLLHDDALGLRDMSTAHAYLGTCRRRAKVDDVGESDLPAS